MVVKFNYNLLNKNINYELANLTKENIELGSTSTILRVKPSYITPSGEIYYTTTDHYAANFHRDIDNCFREVNKTKERPSIISIIRY